MKLKSVFGALVAFGAMALMAVGVQAATYSAGVVKATDGVAAVPITVAPDSNDSSSSIEGYIIKITYDKTKVTPKIMGKDVTGADRYADIDPSFRREGANAVFVSDIVSTEGNNETLAVAWACSDPIDVTQEVTMAAVDFDIAPDATGSVPIDVQFSAFVDDNEDGTFSIVKGAGDDGAINIDAEKFLRGDADGSGDISVLDAAKISQYLNDLETIDSKYMGQADADASGDVNVLDAAKIAQYLNSLETIPE